MLDSPKRRSSPTATTATANPRVAADRLKQVRQSVRNRLAKVQEQQAERHAAAEATALQARNESLQREAERVATAELERRTLSGELNAARSELARRTEEDGRTIEALRREVARWKGAAEDAEEQHSAERVREAARGRACARVCGCAFCSRPAATQVPAWHTRTSQAVASGSVACGGLLLRFAEEVFPVEISVDPSGAGSSSTPDLS